MYDPFNPRPEQPGMVYTMGAPNAVAPGTPLPLYGQPGWVPPEKFAERWAKPRIQQRIEDNPEWAARFGARMDRYQLEQAGRNQRHGQQIPNALAPLTNPVAAQVPLQPVLPQYGKLWG